MQSARTPTGASAVILVVFLAARYLSATWSLAVTVLAALPLVYALSNPPERAPLFRDIALDGASSVRDGGDSGKRPAEPATRSAASTSEGAAKRSSTRRKRSRAAAPSSGPPAPILPVVIEQTTEESVPRFLTANTREPIPFENRYFKGHVLIKVMTDPVDPHFAPFFALGKRVFEIQVQGKFKQLPDGTVYMGTEVSRKLNIGFMARTAGKMVLGIAKTLVRGLHSSFGVADESEAPHLVFPLTMSVDRYVVTPPGQQPPALGVSMLPGTDEENAARRKAARLDDAFSLDNVYSLSFHSGNLDLVQWRIVKLPGVSDMELRTFADTQPIRIVAYCMGPGDFSSVPHLQAMKSYFLAFEFTNNGEDVRWPSEHEAAAAAAAVAADADYYSDDEAAGVGALPGASGAAAAGEAAGGGLAGGAAAAAAGAGAAAASVTGAAAGKRGRDSLATPEADAAAAAPHRLPTLDISALSVPACLECTLDDQMRAVVYVVQIEGTPRSAGVAAGHSPLRAPRMLSDLDSRPTPAPAFAAPAAVAFAAATAAPASAPASAPAEILAYEYGEESPFLLDDEDRGDSPAPGHAGSSSDGDDPDADLAALDADGDGLNHSGSLPGLASGAAEPGAAAFRIVSPGPLRSAPPSPGYQTPRGEQHDEHADERADAVTRFSVLRTFRDFVDLDESLRGAGPSGARAPLAGASQPLGVDEQRGTFERLLHGLSRRPEAVASRPWGAFMFSLGRADLKTLRKSPDPDVRLAVPGKAAVVREGVVARALWPSFWREESMVLTDTTVSFFGAGTKKPVSVVNLFEVMCVEPMPPRAQPFAGFAFFQLETPARIHYVCTKDADDALAWVEAIARVRSRPQPVGESSYVYRGPGAGGDSTRRLTLNARRMIFELSREERALGAVALGEELLLMALRLSSDSTTETVTAFLNRLALLRLVRLDGLSLEQRTCFFLNVYHTLLVHALLIVGPPSSVIGRKNFHSRISYEVAGCELSLFELQHSVIRAGMSPPKQLSDLFLPAFAGRKGKAPAFAFALTHRDVRLNFALNLGTRSCLPSIMVFTPDLLNAQLDRVACLFAARFVSLSEAKGVVTLPKVCQWYAKDFAPSSDKFDVLRAMLRFVPADMYNRLSLLLARDAGCTVKYQPFLSAYWHAFDGLQ